MAGSRTARAWELVAEHAARRGSRVNLCDVCTAAVERVAVNGAALNIMREARPGHAACSTDEVSARLEELQLTLGEGPCVDAFTSAGPVLTADLKTTRALRRWPAFAPAALEAGAAAAYSFPLQIGAIQLGVLDMYRRTPRGLSADEVSDALVFAGMATLMLLDAQAGVTEGTAADGPAALPGDLGGNRAEVDQATGILTVQLDVGIEDAFVRLRAYAFAHNRHLADVAQDVVSRRLRFNAEPVNGFNPEPRPADDGT